MSRSPCCRWSGCERHDVPGIGRVLAGRRLGRIDHAERPRAELHDLRHAVRHHVLVRGEQFSIVSAPRLHFSVRWMFGSNFSGVEAHRLVQREVQAEERPRGVLEVVELLQERRRKLLAADVVLEGLVHVEGRGDELPGPHGAAVLQRDAGRLAALDDDAVELDLRRKAPAGGDEGLEQRRAPDCPSRPCRAGSRFAGRRRGSPSPSGSSSTACRPARCRTAKP